MSHSIFKARTANRITRPMGAFIFMFLMTPVVLVAAGVVPFVIWALLK